MIEAVDVAKVYRRGRTEVRALAGVSLTVPKGEFLSVMGPSGSGKSTLLNLLGALDVPSSGSLRIDGRELSRMKDDELSAFRRERLGFVFQFFNLMPTLTALENVMLPGLLSGKARAELQRRAEVLLETVGLGGRTHH
ncbi:MAG TPA: ATP-binding cassette domain-containing protein, partial [Archangium sp.]|nr:ATP-binding cassette domain-containing protein [Archangium sp.]